MKNIFFLLCFALCIQGQAFSQLRKTEKLAKEKAPNLKLAYLSRRNLNNPGINLGAEFMMQRKTVTIKNFTRTKEKFITANLSIFDEPNLYSNVAFHAEWLKRTRYGNGGFFTEASVGFGLGRAFNYVSPPTYVKNPDGTESIKRPKTNFITAPVTLGMGYDFKPGTDTPIKIFARGGIYPVLQNAWTYNNFLKREIGVITSLALFKRK
jgi:hypothetical protein